MRRAISSISNSRPRAALWAAALIIALEAALAGTGLLCGSWFSGMIEPLPVWVSPSISRDAYFNDCRLRDCRASGRRPVVFLGSSPALSLDLPYLAGTLERRGAAPVLWAYSNGFFAIELLAMRPALEALRPRALVFCSGPSVLAAYTGANSTRLAYFPITKEVLARLPEGPWRYPRLLGRTVLANVVAAFRYQFLLKDEVMPGLPGRPVVRSPDISTPGLFTAAAGELSLSAKQGREALDAFFAAWKRTGVPIVVWDAPRTNDPSVPGRALPPEVESRYQTLMEDYARRHGFLYLGPRQRPFLAAKDFVNTLHLSPEASVRFTAFLADRIDEVLAR